MKEISTGIFVTNENDKNIYMIGDIHGDYQCLIHCLVDLCKVCEITKVFDDKEFNTLDREYLSWIKGSNSTVILCGDLIHRKRFADNVLDDECSDVFIIQILLRLKKEARENKGDIIIIAGNHEILNILQPEYDTYTSEKNKKSNDKYFNSKQFINEYIQDSYAWIKINNILIAHGGLCSDYLRFLDDENIFKEKIYKDQEPDQEPDQKQKQVQDKKNIYNKKRLYHLVGGMLVQEGNGIVEFVNDKYRSYFTNLDKNDLKKDMIAYNLFVDYNEDKHKLNMFWCREWGYAGIDCKKFKEILSKVGCEKIIIAHCPQFISADYPKMINFECVDLESINNSESFNIARIDLGMSRSFDYNKPDNFLYNLSNNYNRKMSVLKLQIDKSTNKVFFNINSIITLKLSCIQYLLLKYGLTKEKWKEYSVDSNWLGFEYLKKVIGHKHIKSIEKKYCSCRNFFNIRKSKKTIVTIESTESIESIDSIESNNLNINSCKQDCKKLNIITNNSNTVKAYVDLTDKELKANNKELEQTILCLLYPILNCDLKLKSIEQFHKSIEQFHK